MCGNSDYQHMYLDNKQIMKQLFPELNWKEQEICEKCAQRESGRKYWEKNRRNK